MVTLLLKSVKKLFFLLRTVLLALVLARVVINHDVWSKIIKFWRQKSIAKLLFQNDFYYTKN